MSRTSTAFASIILAALVSTAAAADDIRADLKALKWKSEIGGGEKFGGYEEKEKRFGLYVNGTATGEVSVPEDGEYKITVRASCQTTKGYAAFKLSVGGTVVAKEHFLTTKEMKSYTFTAKLKKGKQELVVAFLNDIGESGDYDRNLFLHELTLAK